MAEYLTMKSFENAAELLIQMIVDNEKQTANGLIAHENLARARQISGDVRKYCERIIYARSEF